MTSLCYGLLSLILTALGCLISDPAFAQPRVLVTPEALTIAGTRGNTIPTTRTLTVRSTEPITNLRIHTFDLYNSDHDRIFPQQLISAPSALAQVNAETPQPLPMTFSLQGAPSGEFRGTFLLITQGSEAAIPITIRVKDPWHLPFALLVLGVILGTTVSSYSRWGKTSDEIIVSIESLRTQVTKDPEIPPSFSVRISTHLVDAKLAQDARQLETAQQSVTEGRTLWNKWFRQRSQWLEALAVGEKLEETLASLSIKDVQTPYLQAIQQNLRDTLAAAADFDSANQLGAQINHFSQNQAFYLQVWHQFNTFHQELSTLIPNQLSLPAQDQLQNLKDDANYLHHQLTNLLPSGQLGDPKLHRIQTDIKQAFTAYKVLKREVENKLPTRDIEAFKLGQDKSLDNGMPLADEVAFVPTAKIPPFSADENPVLEGISALIPDPNQRLKLFSLAGYLATIAFLAGSGFNQLYLEHQTFGDKGFRDYSALLAWGFGAEATRSAIANALRRTDESKR